MSFGSTRWGFNIYSFNNFDVFALAGYFGELVHEFVVLSVRDPVA